MIELEMISGVAAGNKTVTNAAYVTIGRSQADGHDPTRHRP